MLSNVSWGQFLTGVGLLLVVYYLVICAGYLRKDIAAFLSKLQKRGNSANDANTTSEKLTVEQLERIVDDLRPNVFGYLGHSASKEEILNLLQTRLSGNPALNNKPYRYALGNAIVQLAAEMCGVEITEQDLTTLWDKI
jgi:hypothetical protein